MNFLFLKLKFGISKSNIIIAKYAKPNKEIENICIRTTIAVSKRYKGRGIKGFIFDLNEESGSDGGSQNMAPIMKGTDIIGNKTERYDYTCRNYCN